MVQRSWKNEDGDASDYLTFILRALNIAADKSRPLEKEQRKSLQYPAEQDKNLACGVRIKPLDEDRQERWAYIEEGNDSAGTNALIFQLIGECKCPDENCYATPRSFQYLPVMTLDFPKNVKEGLKNRLSTLLNSRMKEKRAPTEGAACPFTKQYAPEGGHPPRRRFYCRFGKTPGVLRLSIRRGTGVPGSKVHMNRVDPSELLDLSPWVDKGENMYSEKERGERVSSGDHSRYRLVAMNVYSDVMKHYKSFIRGGDDNKGD
jgi:hypothetical protein